MYVVKIGSSYLAYDSYDAAILVYQQRDAQRFATAEAANAAVTVARVRRVRIRPRS